jgi:hypothetical protein
LLRFFGDGGGSSRSRSNDDVCGFSFLLLLFLLQCSVVASSTRFELAGGTDIFFVDAALLSERIRNYGGGEYWRRS